MSKIINLDLRYNAIEQFLKNVPHYAGKKFGLDNNDLSIIEKKVLYVWRKESLNAMRLSADQKAEFSKHILSLNIDTDTICGKNGDKEYYILVEEIAKGHGIRKSNTGELYMLSASSKYCGHHNRIYPFYDKNNREMLKKLGYPVRDGSFEDYVKAFRQLQNDNKLKEFTLREIDYYLWENSKELL